MNAMNTQDTMALEARNKANRIAPRKALATARSGYRIVEPAIQTISVRSVAVRMPELRGNVQSGDLFREGPQHRGLYARSPSAKRVFDVAFSTLFLVLVASWLFPAIALAIRINSKGPAFFRQQRVGQDGQIFKCLKFRTMRNDPKAAFMQAQKNDPRITKVGAFLRRTNLDELPQFINVLRGEMSVVGPRPHVPDLDHKFSDLIPGYAFRHRTRPGVTGLAQVSGCRGETRSVREMTHRIRFDSFYVLNMSFFMDLKIIALTVLRVAQGDQKAY